jgi:hypothetical protein
MNNTRSGFAHLMLLATILVVAVIAGIGVYMYSSLNTTPMIYPSPSPVSLRYDSPTSSPVASQAPTVEISNSDSVSDMQKELDATTVTSVDSDLSSMSRDASAL